jgi:hypothetical protein
MMNQRLGVADRTTLSLWRSANVLGWSLLSLALALFLRRGFEAAADLIGRHSLMNVSDWLGYWEYALFVLVPSSTVCGLLVGSIVGSRVFRKPPRVAVFVAALYAIVTWVIMRAEPVPHATSIRWISAGLAALTVPVAGAIAHRVAGKLPTAPRLDQLEAGAQAT